MADVIDLHPKDDVTMSDDYMFVGFAEDGRLIMRLPDSHASACQLLVILQKHLFECTGDE